MTVTAYRYNDAQPEWMYAIAAAWARKTDASRHTQEEILKEWRLGSVKLMVEYNLLIEEAEERNLVDKIVKVPEPF
jgi:hypothetical protein